MTERITKNWSPCAHIGWLYANHYEKDVAFIQRLAAIARIANPSLTDDQIKVNVAGGDTIRGCLLLEFPCPEKPNGWDEAALPLILG